jgi:hypothetical protein
MQIKNIQIFSSTAPANGAWIDVSNLVSLSVMLTGLEATVTIEGSNDPNVPIDGPGIGAPPAPVLSQFQSLPQADSGNSVTTQPPGDVSQLPATTFFVKTTFITKWGETTASAESSLAVLAGNYLFVAAPVPSLAQQPYVVGYNVYVGLSSGTEVLQTGPQFQPQRLIDGIGSTSPSPSGGTVNPLGPGQSIHFALNGAIPLITNVIGGVVKVQGANFSMVNGFQQTQWVPPVSDQSGSANVGVKIPNSGTLVGATSTTIGNEINLAITGTNVMVNPSSLVWKWLRVRKDSSSTALATTAWLMGQNG